MDDFDTIKTALDEDGYYIDTDKKFVVISPTFNQLYTITSEDEAALDNYRNAIQEMIKDLKPVYEKALEFSKEMISTVNEVLPEIMQRTPEAIKRDIKHEKNPMRLKQLNRELNLSYKFWRKGK